MVSTSGLGSKRVGATELPGVERPAGKLDAYGQAGLVTGLTALLGEQRGGEQRGGEQDGGAGPDGDSARGDRRNGGGEQDGAWGNVIGLTDYSEQPSLSRPTAGEAR